MSGVVIYMEGGGPSVAGRSALRQGMDAFLGELKNSARKKSWNWKLVCCGSRNDAFNKYRKAEPSKDFSIVVLLVDSEGPVLKNVHEHLQERDPWDVIEKEEDCIHLMVQSMETWIISDTSALAQYYQNNFRSNVLPRTADLETVPKANIASSFNRATERTKKGKYHKINHASDLLKIIDSNIVQSRCSYCKRMFDFLGKAIS